MKTENPIIPFSINKGEYYTVLSKDGAVGIFISNGIVQHFPDGDEQGNIYYGIQSCLFLRQDILNPVVLAGPDIDGHGKVCFSILSPIRHSTIEEEEALARRMKKKGFALNLKTLCVEKIKKNKS